jgi:quercetin dioxygenase-like cupin family protein
MKTLDIPRAARESVAANANRPATTVVHDSPGARLVVFRIAPGQAVPPHRNASTVTLTVISGRGFIRGGDDERPVVPANTVVFEPNEIHGMRAELEELVLLATITPRPGTRAADAPQPAAVARPTAATPVGEEG